MGTQAEIEFRQAIRDDADKLLSAHRASILGEGAKYYAPEIVEQWQFNLRAEKYLEAMDRGEVFFIAVRKSDDVCLGFSGNVQHGERDDASIFHLAIYVHPEGLRQGIGTRLYRLAEDSAKQRGAKLFEIDSSTSAKDFYETLGFENLGEGSHRLRSGHEMQCFRMKKQLV